MNKDLNKLSKEIYEANKAKGFHEEKYSLDHMICLVISELMEAVEADRKGRKANLKAFYNDGACERYLHNENYKEAFKKHVKDTVEDELADAVIRLLDTAGALEMRLEKIDKDNNFDYLAATKEGSKKHSFTENIFHIIDRYFRSSENFNYRLSRMIFHIDILCEVLTIDLWKHIDLKFKYNSLRPYKHGKQY